MARVTVEDCIDKITNRFDLVLLAAQRAREISGGSELTIERDRDKNPVVALREIAEETVYPAELKEGLIVSLQKVQVDDDDMPDESVRSACRQRRCALPLRPRRAPATLVAISRADRFLTAGIDRKKRPHPLRVAAFFYTGQRTVICPYLQGYFFFMKSYSATRNGRER